MSPKGCDNGQPHPAPEFSTSGREVRYGHAMITQADLDNWFTYHSPRVGHPERYRKIRAKAKELAEVIMECAPASPDQTVAIRKVREAVMIANQAIACEPEPLDSSA